jgi:hypothetical protein
MRDAHWVHDFVKMSALVRTYEGVSKSFWTESITKHMLTFGIAHWEAIQRVMAAKLARLTHKIAVHLHLVAESCTICSSRQAASPDTFGYTLVPEMSTAVTTKISNSLLTATARGPQVTRWEEKQCCKWKRLAPDIGLAARCLSVPMTP